MQSFNSLRICIVEPVSFFLHCKRIAIQGIGLTCCRPPFKSAYSLFFFHWASRTLTTTSCCHQFHQLEETSNLNNTINDHINHVLSFIFQVINSRAMNAIKAGMQEWTSKTCIRFKPRTNESAYAIFRIGKG